MAETSEKVIVSTISPAQIENFIEAKRKMGRSEETLDKYRRDLMTFYDFLPEDKQLTEQAFTRWRASMKEEGYALRTLNSRSSAVNSFLKYLGRRDLQIGALEKSIGDQPQLTRQEHLRLLSTAKALEKERLYLWVKLFACVEIRVQSLGKVTRESVEVGFVTDGEAYFRLPPGLREELRAYVDREGVTSGPLFRMKNGQAVRRTFVTDSIRVLAKGAGVSPEKANPRCLQKLCRETLTGIEREIARLVERSYEHLLETEQLTIGWDQADAV